MGGVTLTIELSHVSVLYLRAFALLHEAESLTEGPTGLTVATEFLPTDVDREIYDALLEAVHA